MSEAHAATTTDSPSDGSDLPSTEMPSVGVRGDFLDSVGFISDGSISLVSSIGYLDENRPVLLPFAALRLASGADDDGSTDVFEQTVTLENFVSLMSDLALDFSLCCRELRLLARDGLTLEPVRLDYIDRAMARLQDNIAACVEDLSALPKASAADDT